MSSSSSSDDDEPFFRALDNTTVDELQEADIETVKNQMVCEIFRLAGKNPTDHPSCFQACVGMVKDTDVIHATDFKKWEKHQYIQAGLDNLQSAQQTTGPVSSVTLWMINAPLAVAATAAASLPRMRIQEDSRLISAFNEGNLWNWVGCAIDFWTTSSGPIVSTVPRGSIVHLMQQGKTTDRSGLPQCTVYPLRSVTLPLFVHFHISHVVSPSWDWLQDKMVPTLVITRREEAMEKGKEVLAKLGSEHHDQAVLREPLDQWLTEKSIRVLPKDVKDKLWLWCLRHHALWQPFIARANEDLTEYHEVVYLRQISVRQISVCLASRDLQRWLACGRCLVLLLEDRVSRGILDQIVHWMRYEHENERHTVSSEANKLWKMMTDDLKSKLAPERLPVQGPQEPLFAGPKDEAHREVLILIIQQIFDASICVSPKCPSMVDTWLVLLPKMDDTLLHSFCFDMDKAKQRRASAKKRPWRARLDDEKFSEMAATVNKIDPESLLMAYIIFLVYMPQVLGKKGSKLLWRCLKSPKALSTTSASIVLTRKRQHSEFEVGV